MVPLPELGVVHGQTLSLQTLPQNLPDWPLDLAQARFSAAHHGDYPRWAAALADLPTMADIRTSYGDTVSVRGATDTGRLEAALRALHPWRKGPFQVGEIHIDTEWRSDWKWQRLAGALGKLDGARVLDIGCGNGYFGWRLLEAGADEVIGIDPTLLFCMQHLALQTYINDPRNWVLPLGIDELPTTAQFDLVLSMGVIYHRREPLQHVQKLAELTAAGGRIVLESLVVEGKEDLYPEDRYARMRNVWCVPCTDTLAAWLRECGFANVDVVSVAPTTTAEQRSTNWMHFESLAAALDPSDPGSTIEGYPAPRRAMLVASC